MKAINFVTEISKIKPNKLEIKKNTDFSDEFIDAYINQYCVKLIFNRL